MSVVRYAALGAVCLALQGCWFVFIPGSLLAGEKYYCVGEMAKPGDHIKLTDGREATVRQTYGTYTKCQSDYGSRFPVKADLDF